MSRNELAGGGNSSIHCSFPRYSMGQAIRLCFPFFFPVHPPSAVLGSSCLGICLPTSRRQSLVLSHVLAQGLLAINKHLLKELMKLEQFTGH